MNTIKKLINPALVIFLAALLRLVPHMPNFAPVTAMALFGGVYLSKKYALIVPLLVMILSDYLLLYVNPFGNPKINFSHIYPLQALWYDNTILAVYGSFLLSGFIGLWVKEHKTVKNILLAAIVSSVQFFLITNAAVWIAGAYDRSIMGLWESLIAGIPFFRGTILGDLFYTGVFFSGYELLLHTDHIKKLTFVKAK